MGSNNTLTTNGSLKNQLRHLLDATSEKFFSLEKIGLKIKKFDFLELLRKMKEIRLRHLLDGTSERISPTASQRTAGIEQLGLRKLDFLAFVEQTDKGFLGKNVQMEA